MTCGRELIASCGDAVDGAAASHSAELVRGDFFAKKEGPLIRPVSPKASLRLDGPPSPQGEKGSFGLRCRISATVLTLVLSVALYTPGVSACTVPEGFARVSTPEAEIAYRWEPDELRVGRFFAAEVIACRAPGPEAVRAIALDAQMPAHGHGMNYRPTVRQTGPGSFRFTGLMLHMAGTWRLTFDLFQGDRRTRLTQEVTLEP